jgi:hypothetical protein
MISSLPALALLLLSGCRNSNPTAVTFTEVPAADAGGPGKLATVSGKVVGAAPGDMIVIYAKSQRWWVQPFADRPFTSIGPDGAWNAHIHLGTEYAALLVHPGFHPPPVTDTLPSKGTEVVAVATSKGSGPSRAVDTVDTSKKLIHFSGYDWEVRSIEGDRNGSPNNYSTNNATVDSSGLLHLRITGSPGAWTCSEVIQTRGFGYGTYRFTLHDVSHMEPALALSLFTWDDTVQEPPHRELTIEFSRWGDPASKNGQFVVQPYYIPANVSRFDVPPGPVAASIHWESGKATFEAASGSHSTHPSITHVFTSGVPTPGEERVRMHLCGFHYSKVPLQHEAEVVVEKFEYLP